jgi:hypothetical protein
LKEGATVVRSLLLSSKERYGRNDPSLTKTAGAIVGHLGSSFLLHLIMSSATEEGTIIRDWVALSSYVHVVEEEGATIGAPSFFVRIYNKKE